MKLIKIFDENERDLKAILNVDLCIVNGLRRVMMADMGGYAFDDIEIKKNTTIFHDELLKHRIGLIPVTMGSELTFGLNMSNNEDKERYVLSDDIMCFDENVSYKVMKNIPILVLRKDDRIEFSAKTIKGSGKEDMKYSMIENMNFVKMKEVEEKQDIPDEVEENMYENLYYGRKYLLERNNIKYKVSKKYCLKVSTVMMNVKQVLSMGLLLLRNRLVRMRDINYEEILVADRYYNFRIHDIDYIGAGIFAKMLLKRGNVKIATFTKKHLLDSFFEFKIELNESETLSILKIKEEEMNKVIKLIDEISKEIK